MAVYGGAVYGGATYGESVTAVTAVTVPIGLAVAAGFSPVALGDTITTTVPLATSVAACFSPSAAQQATVVVRAALAVVTCLTPSISADSVSPSFRSAVAIALTSLALQVISGGTDSSNAMDGRSRDGISTGTTTRPVASVPPGLTLGVRVDKAIAYPTPTMVNGRPT